MLNRFSRTELLFGKEGMEKLHNSRVAVFGIGGVGGYTVESLVRGGIGSIDIIDNDKVSLTNINRQIYATTSTIGKYKVDVAKERILDINPDIIVNSHNVFYSAETSSMFDLSEYDYVIDAIDTVSGKLELVVKATEANTPIISSMGAGNKLNPAGFEVSDIYKTSVCPLARVMRQELKKRNIKKLKVVYSKEIPMSPSITEAYGASEGKNSCCSEILPGKHRVPGSNSFVPPVVGLIIAGEVIKDLLELK